MTTSVDLGCYVFGIVDAGASLPAPLDIPLAAGLRLIEHDAVAAVVSSPPSDRPLGRARDLLDHVVEVGQPESVAPGEAGDGVAILVAVGVRRRTFQAQVLRLRIEVTPKRDLVKVRRIRPRLPPEGVHGDPAVAADPRDVAALLRAAAPTLRLQAVSGVGYNVRSVLVGGGSAAKADSWRCQDGYQGQARR